MEATHRGPAWDEHLRFAEMAGRHAMHHGPGRGPGGPGGPGFFAALGGPFGRGRPPFGLGHGPRGRGRMRRGDVRAAILALLVDGPRNGYQMIQDIEERSEGMWRPSAGSIYPALQQLEDEGLVTADEPAGKRTFRLTAAGTTYADEHADALRAPWEVAAGAIEQPVRALFDVATQVGGAVVQVAQAGSAAQVEQARSVLATTRRQLYTILAADEPATDPDDKT